MKIQNQADRTEHNVPLRKTDSLQNLLFSLRLNKENTELFPRGAPYDRDGKNWSRTNQAKSIEK